MWYVFIKEFNSVTLTSDHMHIAAHTHTIARRTLYVTIASIQDVIENFEFQKKKDKGKVR